MSATSTNWTGTKDTVQMGMCLVLFRNVDRNAISAQVLVGLSACCRRIIGCRTKNVAMDTYSHTTDERGQPVLSLSCSHLHRRVLGTTDVCLAQGTHCNTDMPAIYRSLCLGLPCWRHYQHISADSYPSIRAVCLRQRNEPNVRGLPASF